MELHIPKERKTMNAKEIRDIPQDLLVRLGEERNKAPDGEELKPDYIQAWF